MSCALKLWGHCLPVGASSIEESNQCCLHVLQGVHFDQVQINASPHFQAIYDAAAQLWQDTFAVAKEMELGRVSGVAESDYESPLIPCLTWNTKGQFPASR